MAAPLPTAYLVRVGPPPEEVGGAAPEDALVDGFWVPLSAGLAAELADPDRPLALYAFAAELWRRVADAGYGHMLIGEAHGLEAAPASGAATCGAELLRGPAPEEGGPRPRRYTPLFAVARARRPEGLPPGAPHAPESLDLSLDYRGSAGPGDTSLRPVVFDVGARAPAPEKEDSGGG
jgi:hypothetical protein